MAEFAKYHGLELPIFPTAEVSIATNIRNITPESLSAPQTLTTGIGTPEGAEESVLFRISRIYSHETTPLKKVLETAGIEFEEAAQSLRDHGLRARVARHTFGLFRLNPNETKICYSGANGVTYKYHPSIPEGYGLAAEIEYIDGQPLQKGSTENYQSISNALTLYRELALKTRRVHWTDAYPRQYMRDSDMNANTLTLVDIEPLVRLW